MLKHKKKLVAAVVAGGIATGVLLTGTFAWQSINQRAMNEVMAETNPGGRLHDDFNGKNKDIYVENFTDELEGMPIFARIRLYEYMETGVGAGDPNAADRNTAITVLGKTDADINDSSSWAIHHFGEDVASNEHLTFHDYITWDEDGGSTVYMPTFNKNKDSLISDINGTLAGPDGYRPGDENDTLDRYQDYQTYNLGDTLTGNAIYDADDNPTDEVDDFLAPDNVNGGVLVAPGGPAVDGEHYQLTQETHTAQYTQDCTVITIDQWEALDPQDQVGNYWVYDTDGWAYWASPIMPGTATGLLLDGISVIAAPDREWYYAIDAVAQFATDHGWGTKDSQDGFYAQANGGMQDRGAAVLEKAANSLNNHITITLHNTVESIATVDSMVAQPGDRERFAVVATIDGVDQEVKADEVEWSVSGDISGASSIAPYVFVKEDDSGYEYPHDFSALLSIADSVPTGTTLTVAARYQGMTDQIKVEVKNLTYDDLGNVIPGSLTTVTIDSYRWYVLARENGKVLLWSDDHITMSAFDAGNSPVWEGSDVQAYLQGQFLNSLNKLKQEGVIAPTDLTTWNGTGQADSNWILSEDETIFLLTAVDLYGKINCGEYQQGPNLRDPNLKDYTYQINGKGQVLAPDVEMRKCETKLCSQPVDGSWGREATTASFATYLSQHGTKSCAAIPKDIWDLRPAMWVNLNVPDAEP